MSVLVTGGAGYIGSHTARLLRERGHDVVIVDSMEFGHEAAVLGAPLVVADVADSAAIERVCREHGVDACVHFAAYKAAGESMEMPERYFGNNVAGTLGLLEGLRAAGVDRLVFSSTCAVYGTPNKLPVAEDNTLHPESPYGQSKYMVEQMLQWYDTCHQFRSVSLRYFNAAGASRDGAIGEDWTVTLNLVPIVMKAALGVIPAIAVYGTDYPTRDGTCIRDYIHVEDLADAHVKALEYLADGGATTVVNLGTGVGSTVKEVIEATERMAGVKVPYHEAPRRPGDPVAIFADNTRAREVLGWVPDHGLDAIVASAWQWHSAHPNGYSDEVSSG
jgi:UDP-glucose 4-epimerase